ncbi:MarC family protein [Dongshaea marina]|uniref:MarC family protein n=1 Tax=Dongshaea marina TaxID=2047966 RepID=UPI000D3E7183|nr:MarC family protein [Dongshaea marina]
MILLNSYLHSLLKISIIVNPITMLAIFIAYTGALDKKEIQQISLKTCTAVGVTLLITTWFGVKLFSFFGVSLPSLQIAGGLSLLISCLKCLNDNSEKALVNNSNIAIVPLCIPIIAGPAALSVIMSLVHNSYGNHPVINNIAISGASITISLILGLLFFYSSEISTLFGEIVINTVRRISYLILACIGVNLLSSGILYFIG